MNTSQETPARITGNVKWFNNKTGYGFITFPSDTNDENSVFVHHSGIQTNNEQYTYLVQGEYVEFDLQEHDDKTIAVNVTGINCGKLMCETHTIQKTNKRPQQMRKQPLRRNRNRDRDTNREWNMDYRKDNDGVEWVVVPRHFQRRSYHMNNDRMERGRGQGQGRGQGRGRERRPFTRDV